MPSSTETVSQRCRELREQSDAIRHQMIKHASQTIEVIARARDAAARIERLLVELRSGLGCAVIWLLRELFLRRKHLGFESHAFLAKPLTFARFGLYKAHLHKIRFRPTWTLGMEMPLRIQCVVVPAVEANHFLNFIALRVLFKGLIQCRFSDIFPLHWQAF